MNHQQGLLHYRCMRIILAKYPDANLESIVKCCDEWIEKDHKIPSGVLKYFQVYFQDQ